MLGFCKLRYRLLVKCSLSGVYPDPNSVIQIIHITPRGVLQLTKSPIYVTISGSTGSTRTQTHYTPQAPLLTPDPGTASTPPAVITHPQVNPPTHSDLIPSMQPDSHIISQLFMVQFGTCFARRLRQLSTRTVVGLQCTLRYPKSTPRCRSS